MRRLKFLLVFMGIGAVYMTLTYYYRQLGLSPPFSLCAVLLLSAVASDYGTTVAASRLGAQEGNPLVNLLFKKVGVEIGGLIVVGIFTAIVFLVLVDVPTYQLLAFATAYWLVPLSNMRVIRQLKKGG